MGTIHEQIVVCTTYDWESNDRSKLDELINKNPNLFAKSETMINGVINYVMFWDGSKEGWDDSNAGDKLREKFFKLVKQLKVAEIYEISNHEADEARLYHFKVRNLQSSIEKAT